MKNKIKGETLLSTIIAMLIFSSGLISVMNLMLVMATEIRNSHYRNKASTIADYVITNMLLGDKSILKIKEKYFQKNGDAYKEFIRNVQDNLPGSTIEKNKPTLEITDEGVVDISIKWQTPYDKQSHQIKISTVIQE